MSEQRKTAHAPHRDAIHQYHSTRELAVRRAGTLERVSAEQFLSPHAAHLPYWLRIGPITWEGSYE